MYVTTYRTTASVSDVCVVIVTLAATRTYFAVLSVVSQSLPCWLTVIAGLLGVDGSRSPDEEDEINVPLITLGVFRDKKGLLIISGCR